MAQAITTQTTPGGYVPGMGGIGGVVWQSEITTITVNGAVKLQVIDGTSYLLTSHGRADVSEDVPSGRDHAATVAFWMATVERWEQERIALTAELEAEARGDFVVDDSNVSAPGFTSLEQLEAFVRRARASQLRTWPGRAGSVQVSNSRGDGRYAVSRTSCECQGHRTHGRCMHRAYAVWLADVEGVDLCGVATIGVNTADIPMAPGPVPAMEAA